MSNDQNELQNKAYLFLAKKQAEEIARENSSSIFEYLKQQEFRLLQNDSKILETLKQYTQECLQNYIKFCAAEENSVVNEEYPVGSIISVSVTCSEEEGNLPYLITGLKVNSTLNNIYLNNSEKQGQVFHWFGGKEVNSSDFFKMPGVWKSRGICGGFSNEIVGFKYYLAQRVK
jgi:hypothetical protein